MVTSVCRICAFVTYFLKCDEISPKLNEDDGMNSGTDYFPCFVVVSCVLSIPVICFCSVRRRAPLGSAQGS